MGINKAPYPPIVDSWTQTTVIGENIRINFSLSAYSNITDIRTDAILVDVAISIYEGKVYIMMGYDDPLMVLPLQTEFDYKPTESYKKDMARIANLVEVLNK